jgi:hypothetical protein
MGIGIVPSLMAKIGASAKRSEKSPAVMLHSEPRAVSRKEGSY